MFNVTEPAAAKINSLKESEKNPALALRILVLGGGCSGFQYTFDLTCEKNPDDHVFSNNGADVYIDEVSLNLLKGSELDFEEDLAASMFVIKNPNATAKCGCGNSFGI